MAAQTDKRQDRKLMDRLIPKDPKWFAKEIFEYADERIEKAEE